MGYGLWVNLIQPAEPHRDAQQKRSEGRGQNAAHLWGVEEGGLGSLAGRSFWYFTR
jgi:hypothetical protein